MNNYLKVLIVFFNDGNSIFLVIIFSNCGLLVLSIIIWCFEATNVEG